MRLPIDKIRTDGGTQPRSFISVEVVEEYVEALEAGATFPAVDVFYDGSEYWLADGFHRVGSASEFGMDAIDCTIHQGTLEDARWFSFGANKTNGLYRSNADKRRAIESALKHPRAAELSDRDIARHVGVSHQCVCDWRARICQTLTDTRTVTRKGTTYQQNTANIGKVRASERPSAAPVPVPVSAPLLRPEPQPQYPARDIDSQDIADVQRLVRLCEQINQFELSPKDIRFTIACVEWQQHAVSVIKEACEYLQGAIGTANTADNL